MKAYQKIRRAGKLALISGLFLSSLFFSMKDPKAQEIKQPISIAQTSDITLKKEMPERKITLDFENPMENFEANSNAWYSANQLLGKGSDFLGVEKGLDDKLLGRLTLLGLNGYGSYWLKVASHEMGHTRGARKHGKYTFDFELNSFCDLGENFPRQFKYFPTDEQLMDERIAGLNQEEFNAYTVFINGINGSTVDNSVSFLMTKLWDIGYNVRSGEETNRDDVKEYIRLLNKKGIDLSKNDHLVQALLADALSLQTWRSILDVYNYLVKGKRTTEPFTFNLFGKEFTPPLINHYLTPEGSFYNISSVVSPNGKNPIEIAVGTDVDFIGDGKVDSFRIGGQYNNLKLFESKYFPSLSPYAYLNTNKSLDYEGFSAGVKASLPIKQAVIPVKLALWGKAGYDKDDVLENTVKGKDKGFNAVLGLTAKF